MSGYCGTPLAKKLGIRAQARLFVPAAASGSKLLVLLSERGGAAKAARRP